MSAHLQGEFVSAEHSQEVPILPAALPPPSGVDPTSKMMYMWLTSYSLDAAAYTYKEAGFMDYNVNNNEVKYWHLALSVSFKNCYRYQVFYSKRLQTISQLFRR